MKRFLLVLKSLFIFMALFWMVVCFLILAVYLDPAVKDQGTGVLFWGWWALATAICFLLFFAVESLEKKLLFVEKNTVLLELNEGKIVAIHANPTTQWKEPNRTYVLVLFELPQKVTHWALPISCDLSDPTHVWDHESEVRFILACDFSLTLPAGEAAQLGFFNQLLDYLQEDATGTSTHSERCTELTLYNILAEKWGSYLEACWKTLFSASVDVCLLDKHTALHEQQRYCDRLCAYLVALEFLDISPFMKYLHILRAEYTLRMQQRGYFVPKDV